MKFQARNTLNLRGMQIFKEFLSRDLQEEMVECLRAVTRVAPMFAPVMPSGRPMSVRMTSAGRFGWISDRNGYRYSETHPNGARGPKSRLSLLRSGMRCLTASVLRNAV